MAKIFINLYWNGEGKWDNPFINSYYEGFISTLINQGNTIYLLVTNDLTLYANGRLDLKPNVSHEAFLESMRPLKPDLFISFNHTFYRGFYDVFDCPKIVWFVDPVNCQPDAHTLSAKASQFLSFFPNPAALDQFVDVFKLNRPKCYVMPDATSFTPLKVEQNWGVNFIGSCFENSLEFREFVTDCLTNPYLNKFIKKLWFSFRDEPFKSIDEHFNKIGWQDLFRENETQMRRLPFLMRDAIGGQKRIETLAALVDLDLHVFGPNNWIDTLKRSIDLAMCYEPAKVQTLDEANLVYNQSKVSVNINQGQARLGVSWRVRDIMATNSCLLTNQNTPEDLKTQFGPKIPFPVFESPAEARELASKLLKEPQWRQDIVLESQSMIRQGHRFTHRVKDIEQLVSIPLNPGGIGTLTPIAIT